MRLGLTLLFVATSACAGHYHTEVIGQRAATVLPRGAATPTSDPVVAAPGSNAIHLPQGTYDIALWFDVPRAQVVEWTLSCSGATSRGAMGEPFEAYRTRRIAQLRAERDRQRRQVATATSVLIGAVAPVVETRGQVVTPAGEATVRGTVAVDGDAVGNSVANATVDDHVELAHGDVGRGRVGGDVHITTTADGPCAITAVADDANVLGAFRISRIRDLDAEARLRVMATTTGAIHARATVTTQLVGLGADLAARQHRIDAEVAARQAEVAIRQRQIDAEVAVRQRRIDADVAVRDQRIAVRDQQIEADARARLVIEARVTARLRAEAELRARWETDAFAARGRYIAWLVGQCHADPGRRGRLIAERDAADARRIAMRAAEDARRIAIRDAEDARLRAETEAALRIRRQHIEAAIGFRAQLRGYLVRHGARERPPMPDLIAEDAGVAPFDGASWIAGRWTWTGATWVWTAGSWRDMTRFGSSGDAGNDVVVVRGGGTVQLPVPVIPIIIDTGIVVGGGRTAPPPTVRDYRPPPPPRSGPTVRDHRNPPAPSPGPTVRDHRPPPPAPSSGPTVRDHRTDKKPGVIIRDHRR